MSGQLTIELSFADEPVAEMKAMLEKGRASEIEIEDQRGVAGALCVIICIVAVEVLVDIVTKLLRLWRCGVIVDARGPKVLVEKNCNLPLGTVWFIAPNGSKTIFDKPSELQLDTLLKILVSSGNGPSAREGC